jgi:predicted MFS family arabinose efflux permease
VIVSSVPVVQRATRAVYVAFISSGFAFASWAARIPQVRDRLGVTPGQLGLILLCIAIGSIVALPTSGLVVSRIGEARTVSVMSVVLAVGLAATAIGYTVGVAPVCVGLFLVGLGNGAWDVAMNVQGAVVERALGRSIMSRFHAGFSIGTVAGAGIGALMIALNVPVTAHLVAVAILVAVVVPWSTMTGFLPHVVEHEAHESRRAVLAAWREPRTVLIGVFVLCMAFTEGTGNDWLGIAVIDGYHTSNTLGTVALAIFLAAMTTGRWFGPGLLDRFGRVPVLRASCMIAFVGLVLVVVGHTVALAYLGAAAWGLGASLGFPTGMSAAADDPRRAAARVSVTASIAYTAFLAGPPLIGFVGNHVGVLHGLIVAAALIGLAALIASACAPLRTDELSRPASEPVR